MVRSPVTSGRPDLHNCAMARLLRVRRDQYDAFLQFEGEEHEVRSDDGAYLVAPWLFDGVTIANLNRVARRIMRHWGADPGDCDTEPIVFFVAADLHPDDYWMAVAEKAAPPITCEIHAGPGGVKVRAYATTGIAVEEARIVDIASFAAAQDRCRAVVNEGGKTATEALWEIDVELARRTGTVARLLTAAERVVAAIEARAQGLRPETAATALRAGHPEALVGAHENEWLEAKAAPWNLTVTAGKIELAQDVARLANAGGGLIVVGATTHKESGEDVIVRAHGIRPGSLSVRQVRAIIDARVYPVIEGLDLGIGQIRGSENVVAWISILPQPASAKPFIVHGAIVGRKVEGTFISIVRRRGEGSIVIGPREIHAWLAAGRRLISGDGPGEV